MPFSPLAPNPQQKLVHELFEEQAARTADAVAVICEDQSLTYGELNAKANQLARYLSEKGIGPDRTVGICLERSPEMVIAVLGILKAGGAYVPMDPNYPQKRLQHMLADAAPNVLLTQARLRERLPLMDCEVIAVDEQWKDIAQQPCGDLSSIARGLRSHHLAYVIYTSGSTGQAKGVMIEHGGLANYLEWALRAYTPEKGDAVPVSSPLAFDATVTSLYLPLLSGRSMVLIPSGQELEGLENLLQQSTRWSLVKITPAHLQLLGQRLKPLNPPCTVGAFVIGGEALPPSTVQLWRSMWPTIRLINEYGPTETVVGCSVYDVPENWETASTVPIGRPIANTHMYILDSQRQPVAAGVIGEIYIGGSGVARGYLNRPELTAERFVNDPFTNDPQGRMYKTGDLGRWGADGNIEYLGRNDDQVKIRGYRIELGDIEAQLLRHLQVKDAVVLVREDEPGEKRLVAYIVRLEVARAGNTLNVDKLRVYLRRVLPDYMLPSAFVFLKSLPLTANGKLDRRALPSPERGAYVSRTYEAPQGETEEAMVEIWQRLLRVDGVGREDNFFDLGGDSLAATRVLSHVRSSFQLEIEVSPNMLFKLPTLKQLSARIDSLVQQDVAEILTSGDPLVEHLYERVRSMSERDARELLRDMYSGMQ